MLCNILSWSIICRDTDGYARKMHEKHACVFILAITGMLFNGFDKFILYNSRIVTILIFSACDLKYPGKSYKFHL